MGRATSRRCVRASVSVREGFWADRASQSVYSANCRSWYKLGKQEGRIVGLWPGSNLHAVRALQHPRWEDYEYERVDPEENSLYWLGDGQSWDEKNENGDSACSTRAR